jgi:[glutamine synthetase] adenylyltransferase / [glutamine synthetase]-adenylyl-L-tyrosine phosphorylase
LHDDSPARLGIWDALLPRLRAVDWVDPTGLVVEPAAALLRRLRGGPDPEGALERLSAVVESDPGLAALALADEETGLALVAICGASRALSASIKVHPDWIVGLDDGDPHLRLEIEAEERATELRVFARRSVLRIAVEDLCGRLEMPEVGRRLADVADTAAGAALTWSKQQVLSEPRYESLGDFRITVVAMGKWGAAELNYSSDIDCLFVYQATGDSDRVRRAAQRISSVFTSLLARQTPDGIAFRVDADLRPEGKNGPLARSLASYAAYYEKWGEPWEFQALLKARPVAGDHQLGEDFARLAAGIVWPDSLDPAAIRSIRGMKARSEARAERRGYAATEIKRGFGGIRDAEFAVQLLQLVHGRFDASLRRRATLDALAALAGGGYVREEDADALDASYRWLRTLEHRLQLWDLRQTHALPITAAGRERVAKAMGYRDMSGSPAVEQFEHDLNKHRSRVRGIHEQLFYRPLLDAIAASPTVRLTTEEIARQLAALGFRDVVSARRAVDELTSGLSRRSRLMRQTLPLVLDWLSSAPDPDLGLNQLRLLVTSTTDNAPLVGVLRDDPVAAERLCRMLGDSMLIGRYIDRLPDLLPELGDDRRLGLAADIDELKAEVNGATALRSTWDQKLDGLRRFVRRHVLRVAARDLLGLADEDEVGTELSSIADAATQAALGLSRDRLLLRYPSSVQFAVIGMGRWGGGELGYASDLDLLYVYDDPEGEDPVDARDQALKLANLLGVALGGVRPEGIAYRVDAGLRPEGRAGPLARSLDSYVAYWERWAEPWELQALIRARPVAGDEALAARFLAAAGPWVWPEQLSSERVRAIRTMKARVERERIPPGEDPDFHLKLGPGGLVDVEFTAQLLQQRHGVAIPALRNPGTLGALRAVATAGLLPAPEVAALEEAYRFCTRARNRLYLQTAQGRDSLPTDPEEAIRLGLSLGYLDAPRANLREEYRRLTRRARRVVERRFYRD